MSKTKPRLGMPRRPHERARWSGESGAEMASKPAMRVQEAGR
jgi:hypothetical protein